MTPTWVTAFLDLPAADHDVGVGFWSAVTGYAVSPARGEHGEFATLVPPDGEPFLRTQRLDSGAPRVHVDLHVSDPFEAAGRAVDLGAREVARPGHVVLVSPGGQPFCVVHATGAGPRPVATTSLVDQVSLDIPAESFERERNFWAGLTGWQHSRSPTYAEFERLRPAPDLPIQLLLQRLTEPTGTVAAHLDLAVLNRPAETARHLALGAVVVDTWPDWTVLRDPAGSAYCLTDRTPYDRTRP